MFYGTDRSQLRAHYHEAFRKFKLNEVLTPLEGQLLEIIQMHPEYFYLFDDSESSLYQDFSADTGQTNPYLHMAMHAAIRDQVALNQPNGVQEIYHLLLGKIVDPHEVEHQMMEVLIEEIWNITQNQQPFDADRYLERLRRL